MKEYAIDLSSFHVMAKDEKEAEKIGLKKIKERDIEINNIEEI